MKLRKLLPLLLLGYALASFGTTFNPVQLLNPAGSTSGQAILSTGASSPPAWGNVSISTLTGVLPVANGGTNASSASGTALDNITGFASTGFLTRTGAGTYAFQSATNGITLGNLAQAAANTVLANATGSTANVTAFAMPSCSASSSALGYTSGTGIICNASINAATLGGATFAAPGAIGGTTPGAGAFTTLSASSTVSGAGFSTYLASPPAIGTTAPAAGKFTTLQATSAITPSSTSGIVGTTTNDSANAGSIGEYASSTQSTPQALTTNTALNVTSISLTAGDWDVTGIVAITAASTTQLNNIVGGSNTTSATIGSLGTYFQIIPGNTNSTALYNIPIPTTRYSLSATTTIYLVAQVGFNTSTASATGVIRARRIR